MVLSFWVVSKRFYLLLLFRKSRGLRILDEKDELEVGKVGKISIREPTVFKGNDCNPEMNLDATGKFGGVCKRVWLWLCFFCNYTLDNLDRSSSDMPYWSKKSCLLVLVEGL